MAKERLINCYVCGNDFLGVEPATCCSGYMCGCMGMPIEPSEIVCSEQCYDKLMKPQDKHNDNTF